MDYNEVWNRVSDSNNTVYIGGITNITEDIVRNAFGIYGQIIGVHAFPDRGYAFVRFTTKDSACSAICGVNGMDINGSMAKCSWGKENIEMTSTTTPGSSVISSLASSLYNNPVGFNNSQQNSLAQNQLQAAVSQLGNNSGWQTSSNSSNNWSTANYQLATASANAYPQNSMNYWQGYQNYQSPMMQQGWGVMPNTASASANNGQFQMGQFQNSNGK